MNENGISRMIQFAKVHGGELGFNTLGVRSFTFPNMLMAARFVDGQRLTGVAWIEDDHGGKAPSRFDEPVTVQVDTNLLM